MSSDTTATVAASSEDAMAAEWAAALAESKPETASTVATAVEQVAPASFANFAAAAPVRPAPATTST